jgi:hypothetical protein
VPNTLSSPAARARRLPRYDVELCVALLFCLVDLLLLAVPLVGLMFLPSLFGCAAWAASAARRSVDGS